MMPTHARLGCDPNVSFSLPRGPRPAYERDWANRMAWLDSAASAGVSVLMWVGVDHLSSCRSGWIDRVLRPTNVHALQ